MNIGTSLLCPRPTIEERLCYVSDQQPKNAVVASPTNNPGSQASAVGPVAQEELDGMGKHLYAGQG